jgi:hypothetical protein
MFDRLQRPHGMRLLVQMHMHLPKYGVECGHGTQTTPSTCAFAVTVSVLSYARGLSGIVVPSVASNEKKKTFNQGRRKTYECSSHNAIH